MTYVWIKGCLVVGIVLTDLVLLFGLGFLVRIFGPVKRLTRAAQFLGKTALDKPLGPSVPLGVLSSTLLFNLLAPTRGQRGLLSDFVSFPVGRVIMIVHSSDVLVRRIIKEMQYYAFIVAILFLGGTIQRASNLPNLSFTSLMYALGTNPFHTLDVLALAAIVLLLFRLTSELWRLSDLLSPPV